MKEPKKSLKYTCLLLRLERDSHQMSTNTSRDRNVLNFDIIVVDNSSEKNDSF